MGLCVRTEATEKSMHQQEFYDFEAQRDRIGRASIKTKYPHNKSRKILAEIV
jgi:hypothetical protein